MTDPLQFQEDQFDQKVNFWKRKLRGISLLQFPTLQGHEGERTGGRFEISFQIPEDLLSRLRVFGSSHIVTMQELLATGFLVLLYRYTSQEDIAFILQVASGRDLLLRAELKGADSFNEVLERLADERLAVEGSYLTIGEIEAGLKSRGTGLFLNKTIRQCLCLSGFEDAGSDFADLVFAIDEQIGAGKIYANANLIDEEAAKKLAAHFCRLLDGIVSKPDLAIGALPILTNTEYDEMVVQFNATAKKFPEEKTLFALFEEQVAVAPDNIALIQGERQLTYSQLNEQANRVAHILIKEGVKPGDNIGLIASRDFGMIVGMLGILKAGGAYVPVDPDYPTDRQEYILINSSIKLVIADDVYAVAKDVTGIRFLDISKAVVGNSNSVNPCLDVQSSQLAYTIYTSGSTGRPKGVMIAHKSAVNLVTWVNDTFDVGQGDRLLFLTSMCFDLSVYDIFGMLAAGGSIVIASRQEVQDVRRIPDLIETYKVTFWDSVPTTLDFVIRGLESRKTTLQLSSVRLVLLSGDWIPVSLPDRVKKYFIDAEVIGLGGATEGTVWSNFYPVKSVQPEWRSIPYGKPIANNTFYILNEQMQPQP